MHYPGAVFTRLTGGRGAETASARIGPAAGGPGPPAGRTFGRGVPPFSTAGGAAGRREGAGPLAERERAPRRPDRAIACLPDSRSAAVLRGLGRGLRTGVRDAQAAADRLGEDLAVVERQHLAEHVLAALVALAGDDQHVVRAG